MSNLNRNNTKGKSTRSAPLTPDKIENIQRLVKNGISLRGVARQTGISFSVVHSYAKQFSKQQTTLDFSVLNKGELGYLVGFFVGDGNIIDEKRSGHYGAKFTLDSKRDRDIAIFIERLFNKGGKRVTLYSEGSWLSMKVYSRSLLLFLQGYVNYDKCEGKTSKVLVNPSEWHRDFTMGFIGGLIDADGHVQEDKRKAGHFGAVITTADPKLTEQLVSILNGLGLEVKIGKAEPSATAFSKKPTYYIRLGKTEFSKVCKDMICIRHQRCSCVTKPF